MNKDFRHSSDFLKVPLVYNFQLRSTVQQHHGITLSTYISFLDDNEISVSLSKRKELLYRNKNILWIFILNNVLSSNLEYNFDTRSGPGLLHTPFIDSRVKAIANKGILSNATV